MLYSFYYVKNNNKLYYCSSYPISEPACAFSLSNLHFPLTSPATMEIYYNSPSKD